MKRQRMRFAAGRRTPAGSRRGAAGLVDWIKVAHPAAYEKLQQSRPELLTTATQLDGLGDAAAPGVVDKIANTATQIANAVLPFIQLNAQRKLLNTQVKRAAQGLPPLEIDNLQLPASRVQFDAGENISKWVKYAGLGALGLLAYFMLSRRRSR